MGGVTRGHWGYAESGNGLFWVRKSIIVSAEYGQCIYSGPLRIAEITNSVCRFAEIGEQIAEMRNCIPPLITTIVIANMTGKNRYSKYERITRLLSPYRVTPSFYLH